MLTRLVDHVERHVEHPVALDGEKRALVARHGRHPRAHRPLRVQTQLSQDKDEVSRRQVIAALRAPGPYSHPEPADEMERELG